MTKRTKRRIILMDSILIMSVAALCSSSFAWYMSLRQVSASISSLALETGINATFKYFSCNMTDIKGDTPTGYKDPNAVSQGETKKSVTDYEKDFIEVTPSSNIFKMVDIFPDTRFTYAIEFTSGFTSNIAFSLANYLPGEATEDKDHQRKVNNDSKDPVCLAEAIDIYVNVVKSDDSPNLNLTSESNKVVIGAEDSTDNKLTDVFNFNYADHNGKPYTLKEFNVTTGITYYIFFTIEFSNDPDTYYSYESTSENIDYYTKSTSGTSNVYQRLSFEINKLSILRI